MSFRLILDPADTIAIGDGRPFNQADTGRAVAASVFPPPPDTLYGAARVACARALGWDGCGDWGAIPEITDKMGGWTCNGTFGVSGPFFRVGNDVLLPIPSHAVLQMAGRDAQLVLRKPAREKITTDLGDLRLPDIPPYGQCVAYTPLSGRWGRMDAVMRLLAGKCVSLKELGAAEKAAGSVLPNEPDPLPGWSLSDLAAEDFRVGISRDRGTRLVTDGHLYATVRRALGRGVELFIEVTGLERPTGMEVVVPFGGEACFAFVTDDASRLPSGPAKAQGNYLVYFATPTVLPPPVPCERIEGLPGELVMASVTALASHAGRPGNAGGKGKRAQANIVLPAGSVLFMRNDGAQPDLPGQIGEKTHMGYGRYFTGVW